MFLGPAQAESHQGLALEVLYSSADSLGALWLWAEQDLFLFI